MFDTPQDLYRPIAAVKPSLSRRFVNLVVDAFFVASVTYGILNLPYGKIYELIHGDEYLLQGTGVVSREHVVSVADRGFGGDCDWRNVNLSDYLKKCHARRRKDTVID